MAKNNGGGAPPSRPYEPTHRQQHVDAALENFDKRISKNERRWLLAKGAIGALALAKGSDVLFNVAMGLI